ncbi:Sec-independent protein translocase protein TatCd [Methanosarcinaceae archaeon Ag5]|uniref:Sec-independent protein translocase protein TatC n=1 Tax=Methanolapillus africanus TaxID=3028297 RepID=A0AAE4MJR1_9EURY|nr:Sec-independent protein translocase protein TatCd [Methanosarcinaceae archaeon Ag5]
MSEQTTHENKNAEKTFVPDHSPEPAPDSQPKAKRSLFFKKKHPADPNRRGVDIDYEEHLVEHLRELRNRLIVCIAALIVGAVIFYPLSGEGIAYLWDKLIPESAVMSIYAPTEYVMTRLKLSVACAIAVFFPLLSYETYKFMYRGLYANERKFLWRVVPASFILFLLGASLAYFIVLPIFLNYMIFYADQTAVAQVSLSETINTIITLVLGFGIVFQIPLLMIAAVKMGLIEEKTLRKGRIAVYGALIGFAFLISPDPTFVSQLIAGVALVILFEFSLIIMRFF